MKLLGRRQVACRKHKVGCKRRPQSNPILAKRVNGVSTSINEQVFNWFRTYARTLNQMRPGHHRLMLLHYCKLHIGLVDQGDLSHLVDKCRREDATG